MSRDYEEALLSLSDEEADWAMSLRGELFWEWYDARDTQDAVH